MLELGATCGMGLDYGDVPCAGTICLIAPINGVSAKALIGSVRVGSVHEELLLTLT